MGVTSAITLRPAPAPDNVKGQIEDALNRQAVLEGAVIQVSAQDGTIILSGSIHSWDQRAAARRVAWAAPGVNDVIDNLRVVSR